MSQDAEREKEIAAASRSNPNATYPVPPAELVGALRVEQEGWVTEVVEAFGELTLVVPREHVRAVCAHLKAAPGFEFDMLSDLTGVDRGPEEEPRFEVNYQLFSTRRYHRMRLKVLLDQEDPRVESVAGVWRTANWHERETFYMFGVVFEGHPDLRRILLPDDFQGHALRKDFPLRGYEPYSLT